MTRDKAQRSLALPEPPRRPGTLVAPPAMRRTTHIRGSGWFGWVYRGVDQPRLGRMDTVNRKTNTRTTTWFVDDAPVASLEAALALLACAPAAVDDHPAVVAVREAFPDAAIVGVRDLSPADDQQEQQHGRRDGEAAQAGKAMVGEAPGRAMGVQHDDDLQHGR